MHGAQPPHTGGGHVCKHPAVEAERWLGTRDQFEKPVSDGCQRRDLSGAGRARSKVQPDGFGFLLGKDPESEFGCEGGDVTAFVRG